MSAYSDDPNVGERLALNLREDERGLRPGELANRYLEGLPENLRSTEIDADALASWSANSTKRSWPNWLRGRGASEAAVRLLTLGADSSEISALYVLRQIFLHRAGRGYFRIEGRHGSSDACALVEAHWKTIFVTNCEVTALAPNRIECAGPISRGRRNKNRNGRTRYYCGPLSRCCATLPWSPLCRPKSAKMIIEPTLSLIASDFFSKPIGPIGVIKRLSGAARTSAPCEIWDGSFGQLSVNGLLSVTAGGQPAMRERFAALGGA